MFHDMNNVPYERSLTTVLQTFNEISKSSGWYINLKIQVVDGILLSCIIDYHTDIKIHILTVSFVWDHKKWRFHTNISSYLILHSTVSGIVFRCDHQGEGVVRDSCMFVLICQDVYLGLWQDSFGICNQMLNDTKRWFHQNCKQTVNSRLQN